MKARILSVTFMLIAVLSVLSVPVKAITIDGNGSYFEWKEADVFNIFEKASQSGCGIDYATLKVYKEYSCIYLLVAVSSDVFADGENNMGMRFKINNGDSIRIYSDASADFDSRNYSVDAALSTGANGDYMIEVKVVCFSETEISSIDVQLFNKLGDASVYKTINLKEIKTTVTSTAHKTTKSTTKKITIKFPFTQKKTTRRDTTKKVTVNTHSDKVHTSSQDFFTAAKEDSTTSANPSSADPKTTSQKPVPHSHTQKSSTRKNHDNHSADKVYTVSSERKNEGTFPDQSRTETADSIEYLSVYSEESNQDKSRIKMNAGIITVTVILTCAALFATFGGKKKT